MPYRTLISPAHEIVEVPPHPRLRPGVCFYRGLRIDTDQPRRRLELPVGVATLLLGFDHRLAVAPVDADAPTAPTTFNSLFTGMRTKAAIGEHPGSLHGIEIVMRPWAAYAMFGVPMHQVADRLVEPSDLGGAVVGRLAERLAELPDWPSRFAALDEMLVRWQSAGPGVAPRVLHAWDILHDSAGTLPIGDLAAELDWSERQLERRFREQMGLSPKSAARILRLQHALRMLTAGRPLAEIASRAGFYDQSHLNREIRNATGLTPGAFLAQALRGPAAPNRLNGNVTTLMLEP
ncbi:helix-turn-helix domain-containing protein [Yinghuangia soli]|uniref:Helix-turn-helix domain-containing protein n=1 Tax=Yinghuangia soli TaxID=2908204 RepID=A0AA41PWR4_9ACTN|nr:helix-turn-helix domain-containing protein [Yinghuangia soli]MCF2525972.1 helix-turn-helix domain-containing protein [Yinghuangia soli]